MIQLFRNFTIATMASRTGATIAEGAGDYGLIDNAALVVDNESISWLGKTSEVPDQYSKCESTEGNGKLLTPGLIDCHTHLVWGGSRANEFEMRLQGHTYEQIARAGGGIVSTVSATRAASFDDLYQSAEKRARFLIAQGVTCVEIKSGYGLDLETETKQLDVINRLKQNLPIDVAPTFLGAHTVPPEFKSNPDAYVDLVCHEMIPRLADRAEACDVFCESIGFDIDQSRRVLQTALDHKLGTKIHAEQLTNSHSAKMAAQLGAWSADHLEYLDESGVQAMARHDTVAVLLPGAFYFIREKQKPQIDLLRKHNVPIALATDANPGSSPVASITLMMNMGCTFFGMTPSEALAGLTRHAAKALRREKTIGTIEIGKQADLVIWDTNNPAELAYGIGHNPCKKVIRKGVVIHEN
jgi:imidazolonepropionase